MSHEPYVEVTSQSVFQRLRAAIGGVLFGLLLFVAAFPVLFVNEGRAVKTARSLEEGAASVASVSAGVVDPSYEGRLVHVTADATPSAPLSDAAFGLTANGLRLRRTVEVFQWKEVAKSETRKKLGGGTETVTTYAYEKGWSPSIVDSSQFKQPAEHRNPAAKAFEDATVSAARVTLGAFELSRDLVDRLSSFAPLRLDEASLSRLPTALRAKARLHDGKLFLGGDPTNPAVGDTRVAFEVVEAGPVSVVARQVGNGFSGYTTSNGRSLLMVTSGSRPADTMFEAAASGNSTMTWILRFVGFFMMFMGISMIFRPLAVIADVVPFVGSLVGTGITLASIVVAAPISLVVIAIGWIFYRPLLAILLLLGALAIVVGGVALAFMIRRARATAAAPAV